MRACHCGNECARTRGLLDICGNAGVSWPTSTKTQEHAIPSHRRTNTSPPKPTPPQREGTNRFLPCGVSELLRQTEQELTMGRSLHARNAQMGPRMLQHLLSTPTQSRRRPALGLKKKKPQPGPSCRKMTGAGARLSWQRGAAQVQTWSCAHKH